MEQYYVWLIENSDLRITVVSGDDDSVCGMSRVVCAVWVCVVFGPLARRLIWFGF